NFTTAAFATNTEATVLIESADANAPTILKAVRSIVDSGWNAGGVFTPSELEHYRHAFNKQREKTKSLSGQYGAQQAEPKPIFTIPVAMMTWQQFIKRVASDGHHDVKGRLGVIEKARELF